MPYTQEELQDVDFYREFIDKNRSDYLERIVKNASPENEELRPFRRSDGTIVSFESIDNGLDIVDANLNDNVYSAFTSALNNGAGICLYNFLNILIAFTLRSLHSLCVMTFLIIVNPLFKIFFWCNFATP